jgi:peptide/nickel transport system ATP-binding protein
LLLARALLLDIRLLVADEMISMLDASTRIDVLNLLADLTTRGLSILFITHDLSLAYYISERAVILYRGRVVEMGATERIFSNPLHSYTKMLMASVPRLDSKWEDGSAEPSVALAARSDGSLYGEIDPGVAPALVEAEHDHFVAYTHPI